MAGAKYARRCYINNFQIICPKFYLQTYDILKTYDGPEKTLQHLLQVDLCYDGERDPTRLGPV